MKSRHVQSQQNDPKSLALRRHGLAVLTLGLAAGIIYFELRPPSSGLEIMCQAACWRMAPLTALIWLAYYHILALPAWLALVIPAALAVAVFRPRALLLLLPLIIVIAILRPRKRITNGSRKKSRSSMGKT